MLFLLFSLGDSRYGLATGRVEKIVPRIALRPISKAPEYVAGLFKYRGRAVPVIDLCSLTLGRPCRPLLSSRIILVQYARQGEDLLLGLAAEAVNDLEQLDAADLASPGIINADAPYLGKVAVSTGEAVHCRNCPVFADAGRQFLDRQASPAYLESWTRMLADAEEPAADNELSVLLFRLGGEWLALSTTHCRELVEERPVCPLPHRSSPIFLGLVNIRGELHLCVSLAALLELEEATRADDASYRRMLVAQMGGQAWVFAADEVYGIYHLTPDRLVDPPATLSQAATYTKALFNWSVQRAQDQAPQAYSVGCLDEERVFAALERSIR
jgi:chemotaxis-related protein WspD